MWKKRIKQYMSVITVFTMIVSILFGCEDQGKRQTVSGNKDDRTVLILGNYDYYNSTSEQVMKYVDVFNRTNDTYRIEVRDYSETEDADVAFNMDVASAQMRNFIRRIFWKM